MSIPQGSPFRCVGRKTIKARGTKEPLGVAREALGETMKTPGGAGETIVTPGDAEEPPTTTIYMELKLSKIRDALCPQVGPTGISRF